MLLDLPGLWIALLNLVGIPAAHLLIAWWSSRLPARWFESEPRAATRASLRFYESLLQIRRWGSLLPDAATWFGGFAKATLRSSEPEYLRTFALETRRGEFSHWVQMVAISLFVLWTPYPACWVILVYAALSNLPCILNLRYTRARIGRVLERGRRSRESSG